MLGVSGSQGDKVLTASPQFSFHIHIAAGATHRRCRQDRGGRIEQQSEGHRGRQDRNEEEGETAQIHIWVYLNP